MNQYQIVAMIFLCTSLVAFIHRGPKDAIYFVVAGIFILLLQK